MDSRMFILALAALMLNAVAALPVKQDSLEESTATDEELLQLLAPQDLELEPNSMEHERQRREIDPDIHRGCHQQHNDVHPDELAHEHHERKVRSVGKDSSNSSEEKPKETKQGQQDNSSSSSEEQQSTDNKVVAADVTEKPARRRRAASEELEKLPAESEADLDPVDPIDPTNIEDYAQGCEVLEVDSSEAINNETTYVE